MQIDSQIKKIVTVIKKHYDPDKIILFGSYAYGSPTQNSDLDLLIIKDTNLPRYKRAREIRKWLWGMCYLPKDILVYTKQEIEDWKNVEQAFITQIVKNGKILYEKKKGPHKKLIG